MASPLVWQTFAIVDTFEGIRSDRLAELTLSLAPAATAALVSSILDLGTERNFLLHQ